MVRPAGLEPATLALEGRCSIQLSYGRSFEPGMLNRLLYKTKYGRSGGIRTPDPLHPKQMR